jgi:hypothetical protein
LVVAEDYAVVNVNPDDDYVVASLVSVQAVFKLPTV